MPISDILNTSYDVGTGFVKIIGVMGEESILKPFGDIIINTLLKRGDFTIFHSAGIVLEIKAPVMVKEYLSSKNVGKMIANLDPTTEVYNLNEEEAQLDINNLNFNRSLASVHSVSQQVINLGSKNNISREKLLLSMTCAGLVHFRVNYTLGELMQIINLNYSDLTIVREFVDIFYNILEQWMPDIAIRFLKHRTGSADMNMTELALIATHPMFPQIVEDIRTGKSKLEGLPESEVAELLETLNSLNDINESIKTYTTN